MPAHLIPNLELHAAVAEADEARVALDRLLPELVDADAPADDVQVERLELRDPKRGREGDVLV